MPIGVKIDTARFINSLHLKLWSRLAPLSWRPFEEARAWVHPLGLQSFPEWRKFCSGELPQKGQRPKDIPVNPNRVYGDQVWAGWGDWLGTGTVATRERPYRSFEEARAWVRKLGLPNQGEWQKFCRGELPEKGQLPKDIPANPRGVYKTQGWVSLGDWLGTGAVAAQLRQYLPFKKARAFARKLGLHKKGEWDQYCRGEFPEKEQLPADIPNDPRQRYEGKGWLSWGDWLGTGAISSWRRQFRSFKEARAYVQPLGLKTYPEWRKFCRGKLPQKGQLPKDIPSNPNRTYKDDGWIDWGDWLGTGAVAAQLRQYLPFKKARAFVHGLGLHSEAGWRKYIKDEFPKKPKRPEDIPKTPAVVYKKDWVSWPDWVGKTKS